MDGILIIDKPAGITSHDVVARVRRILKTKRVGHTGTLDPFATGVMIVLIGKATRLAQFIDKDEKEYEGIVRFGYETDTGDRTGVRTVGSEVRSAECGMRNTELTNRVDEILHEFTGEIMQTPPMYSAKKVAGKKLYESAREGLDIERKAVKVLISKLELMDCESTATANDHDACDLRLRIVCSAGTYIRTLAEDIGRRIGIGAHLAELRRTRAGRFGLDQSITLDDLAAINDAPTKLLSMEEAVIHLPYITMNAHRAEKTRSGLSTRIENAIYGDGEALRMLDENGDLLAMGVYKADENSVKPRVVLI